MEHKKDRTWFYIINGLIAVLLLIFVLQNRGDATIKYLGITLDGPAFLIYVVLFFLGVFVGWLWTFFHYLKKERRENRESREEAKRGS
jgi:uncharacterized integral membrane protein